MLTSTPVISLDVAVADDVALLSVAGVIDAWSAADVHARLETLVATGARDVIVDLGHACSNDDSATVSALVSAARDGKRTGSRLFVSRVSARLRRRIETVGAQAVLGLV